MTDVEAIARVCHEANRAWQAVTNGPAPSEPWDQAPQWQRDSAIEGVRSALRGRTPEQLHNDWMRERAADGWRFGPSKDVVLRTHPCMVPYSDLPEEERAKDRLFLAVVTALGSAPRPTDPAAAIRSRLSKLHTKHDDSDHCQHDGEPWPCPTLTAAGSAT